MKTEQLAYFQYQSIATDMLVKATEFQLTREDRLTTIYTVTMINGDKAVTTRPGTRGEAVRQAEIMIAQMVEFLDTIYNPNDVVTTRIPNGKPLYELEYSKLTDGSVCKIKCDDKQSAQELWSTLESRHNHYRMLSPRPR
jgi:hypothetical protein